jgi:hypothetical protein
MAVTQFTPITWGDEPIFKDKLNAMANNDQYLYERMPRMLFDSKGVKKTTGLKILAGTTIMPVNSQIWSGKQVYFGDFFSSGCKPIVVTSYVPLGGRWRYHMVTRGLANSMNLDHRGATFTIGADYYGTSTSNIVDHQVELHYIAIGY